MYDITFGEKGGVVYFVLLCEGVTTKTVGSHWCKKMSLKKVLRHIMVINVHDSCLTPELEVHDFVDKQN